MPTYIPRALTKYQHPPPSKPQNAPYQAAPVQYGAKVQRVATDDSPPLDKKQIKHIQDVVGTLLYFGRVVDLTLAAALIAIAARQANGTQAVVALVRQLLDYIATHPNPAIRYVASDTILNLHTDASYLSELEGKSRAAGHFYMTKHNDEDFKNGGILTLSAIIKIKHVMASA